MSWGEAFNKLPLSTRNFFLSLVVIFPFWWIAIYLFHKPLYLHEGYIIVAAFSFCFSITWYALGLLAALMAADIDSRTRNFKEVAIVGGIVSILYLSFSIIISYWLNFSFIGFLVFSYFYMAIVLVKTLLKRWTKKVDEAIESQEKKKVN